MKLCGETKSRNKVIQYCYIYISFTEFSTFFSVSSPAFYFNFTNVCVVQARRRTTTQMELLYANSNSAPDAPTADFSSPMVPLTETSDGGGEVDSSGSSVRDYTALSPGFSSKMGSM